MELPTEIVMRPHHIRRFREYYWRIRDIKRILINSGKYTPEAAERMTQFYEMLLKNPNAVINVRKEPDNLFFLCSNFVDNKCTRSSEERLKSEDIVAVKEMDIKDSHSVDGIQYLTYIATFDS